MEKFFAYFLIIVSFVYTGACLSIAFVDLPFVKTIQSFQEGLPVFADLLVRMGKLMAPQLVVLFLGILYFSISNFRAEGSWSSYVPLLLILSVLAITLLVHIPINKVVISGTISAENWKDSLYRWDLWHWIRTGISFLLSISIFKYYKVFA
ncbi:DUF1772 domain-containing protein [Leptospira sp. SA-E8]|uniref:DUF1772 domain-containing protein n=1 Tax=Leptospira sp. SA-E8 TaxID=3422259 RepID=UPI003EB7D51C